MALKLCDNSQTVQIKTLLVSLQSQLGLSCLKWYRDEELEPYILSILNYLNSRLILSGACTIIQRLSEFIDFYDNGMKLILSNQIKDLTFMIGIDTTDPEYREELFTLAWGTFMSSTYMQLMYNYAGIFDDSSVSSYDCHGGCQKSECESLLSSGISGNLGNNSSWQSTSVYGDCGCNK